MELVDSISHCHRILSHFQIGLILKSNISLHQHLPAEGVSQGFHHPCAWFKTLFSSFLCRKMTISMGMLLHGVDSDFLGIYSCTGSSSAGPRTQEGGMQGWRAGISPSSSIFLTPVHLEPAFLIVLPLTLGSKDFLGEDLPPSCTNLGCWWLWGVFGAQEF